MKPLHLRCISRRLAAALGVAALLVAAAPGAGAQQDPAARRREVQRQRAEAAAEVDVLEASDAELERALDALDANVHSEEAAVASARDAADSAIQAAGAARAAEERARAQLERLRGEVRDLAVESYIRGNLPTSVDAAGVSSVTDVARAQAFLDTALGRRADLADELKVATADLADRRVQAEEAQAAALSRQRAVESRLRGVRSARASQQEVANSVDSRLERALGEAASLAALDKQLADDIRRRQEALARKAAPAASRPAGSGSTRRAGSPSLRTVRGITVAAEIADNLEGLLNASDGAGLSLGGAGYRSSEGQVQTRRQNCGTSDYDVYEKPASQCSPPTARPGQSMHERGLAVDFTNNGRIISSRSDPAFVWLKANAGRYGFYNLPSEPWHWSTNGN